MSGAIRNDKENNDVDARFTGRLEPVATDPAQQAALLPVLHPRDSHAATLVETTDGDLVCAWFNGPKEGDRETNIVVSRLPAGSDTWTTPDLVAADPDRSEQNPVLFRVPSGQLWLMHTSNEPHRRPTAHIVKRTSDDGGVTWSEPEILFVGLGLYLRMPPVFMPDGSWVLPTYQVEDGVEYSAAVITTDEGATWDIRRVPGSRDRVQMSISPLADGSLLAYYRSRAADRIYASTSTDLGRTWTEPVKTVLPNNNSSLQQITLADGRLVVIFNDATLERDQFRFVPAGDGWRKKAVRTPLTLAMSSDGGQTWPHWRNLQLADIEYKDREVGYSYPTVLQTSDGMLQVAYSYLRKTIRHVCIAPEWIMQDSGELEIDTTEDVTTA